MTVKDAAQHIEKIILHGIDDQSCGDVGDFLNALKSRNNSSLLSYVSETDMISYINRCSIELDIESSYDFTYVELPITVKNNKFQLPGYFKIFGSSKAIKYIGCMACQQASLNYDLMDQDLLEFQYVRYNQYRQGKNINTYTRKGENLFVTYGRSCSVCNSPGVSNVNFLLSFYRMIPRVNLKSDPFPVPCKYYDVYFHFALAEIYYKAGKDDRGDKELAEFKMIRETMIDNSQKQVERDINPTIDINRRYILRY